MYAARFVKFITAIERIVVTNEDDRTETVRKRSAALCWESNSERKMYQLSERIGELYALRSNLVHGDISPLTKESQLNYTNAKRWRDAFFCVG